MFGHVPLHDKNAKTIVSAFEQIFSERIPLKLQTDAEPQIVGDIQAPLLKIVKVEGKDGEVNVRNWELNLFALPPTQTVIERGQWVQFHPIANVSDGGPIEFVISGSGEEYLDLSQTQLLYAQTIGAGLRDSDAFNGNYKKSPLRIQPLLYELLGVYVDGQPIPHQPLELDFEKDNYIRAYQNLFLQSEGLYLSRTEFPKGYALYLFDLSPDLCDGEHFNLIKHSNLRIELKFNKVLEQTVSLIVFAEFESLIEINKNKKRALRF
ncbi:uncharacterized protein F54H12.2 [Trichonephila clavipes]|nr:uncharacterized protein F54H12.2 [Trichonephila clavipes]